MRSYKLQRTKYFDKQARGEKDLARIFANKVYLIYFLFLCVLLVFKKQIITWIKTINWGKKEKKKAAAYVNLQIGLAPGHSESAESVRAKVQGTSKAHHRQPHEQADRTADQSLPKMPRPKANSILV